MYREHIEAYMNSLTLKSASSYRKPTELIAGYLDERGITSPNNDDFLAFGEYVRNWYQSEHGKELSRKTIHENYIGRARKFVNFCTPHRQGELFSAEPEAPQPATLPPVRVNFNLDGETYTRLELLKAVKRCSMSAILTEAVTRYIEAEKTQASSEISALMSK